MAVKGDKSEGGKVQKDRMTALFLCNMDGSDKNLFTIGRSKQPHCFRGKKIPLPYYANTKAWMTGDLWTKIMQQFDNKMIQQKRKVILFADNAACHKLHDIELKNVNIQFLPANTTSIIQPLDQGVIRSFKSHYRHQIIRRQLLAIERGQTLQQFGKSIDVLDALQMSKRAWSLVTPTTIQNCFRKAGFANTTIDETNDPLQDDEQIEHLLIPLIEFNEYIDCDEHLECYGNLNEHEILKEIDQQHNDDDDIENGEETVSLPPTRKAALEALAVLRAFSKHKDIDSNGLDAWEEQFCKLPAATVQNKLSYYFK